MSKKPKLPSSGNPQISKGDGDAPVQAYKVGRSVDQLVESVFPEVQKAVKYVQLTFMRGTSLDPVPSESSSG